MPHLSRNGGTFKDSGDEADDGVPKLSGRLMNLPADNLAVRKTTQRSSHKRYQFESNASDDDIENELSDNLDEIGEATERLRALGLDMRKEIDKHNDVISGIDKKTRELDDKVLDNTERVRCYSKLISTFI